MTSSLPAMSLDLSTVLLGSPVSLPPASLHQLAAVAAGPLPKRRPQASCGYALLGPVAVITVDGILVHRLGTPDPWGGMTGCDTIRFALLAAVADPKCKAVALCWNSPGGQTSGVLDLADTIFQARRVKTVWSIVDDMACGSAYVLASAASRVVTSRTGQCGGVGLVNVHFDLSGALHQAGIRLTTFTHGDRKAMGNPYQPLSREDRSELQHQIDQLGDLLDRTTARNRGTTANRIRALEGRTYTGKGSVSAGLADEVLAPDEAFQALTATVKGPLK